jgi:hypothetical protein
MDLFDTYTWAHFIVETTFWVPQPYTSSLGKYLYME